MLFRLRIIGCVLGAVGLAWSAGMSRAETVYNANDAMYASETSGSPSATFGGVWSVGTRSAAASADFTLYDVPVGDGGLSGWSNDASWLSDVVVNTSGDTLNCPNALPAKGFHMHPDGDGPTEYAVLRWTAPTAGTISTTTIFGPLGLSPTSDVHVVLNGLSLFDGSVTAAGGSVNASLSNITVAKNDVLDIVVGNGNSDISQDATSVFHSVMMVPEPSSLVLLAGGMFGLLAYAWRRRR